MTTFREYKPELYVSFKENKTQRVVFNPDAVMREVEGSFGKSPQVIVEQNGDMKWLTLKSKRLWEQLKNFNNPTSIEITQTGSGTATTYKVVAVKK